MTKSQCMKNFERLNSFWQDEIKKQAFNLLQFSKDEIDFSDKKNAEIKEFYATIKHFAWIFYEFSPDLASSIGGIFIGCKTSEKKAATSRANFKAGLEKRWRIYREQKEIAEKENLKKNEKNLQNFVNNA